MPQQGMMTSGRVSRQLVFFALPLMAANLLQQCYNTADAVIVGRCVGAQALAAVGASSLLVTFMIYFFIGLSAGASILVSQAYGAMDPEKLEKTVHTAVAMSLVSGLILTCLGWGCAPALLRLMRLPDENLADAITYIRLYFLGMVPMIFYNTGSGILRAVGDSKTPFCFLLVTSVLNILLDLVLVAGCGYGVAGAAIATTLAQLVAAVCVGIKLITTQQGYRLSIRKIRFDSNAFRGILKIGVPSGLQSVLVCFANVVVQSEINTFGSNVMAGFTAYMKVDGFLFMPIDAFSLAVSSFVGQNAGAGDLDRVQKGKQTGMLLAVGVTAVLSTVMFLAAEPIIGLFVTDPEVVAFGVWQLRTVVPLYVVYAVNQIAIGAMRGLGKTLVPMLISLVCMCGLRIGWIVGMTAHFPTPAVIYGSYPLTWLVTLVALTVYQKKSIQKEIMLDKRFQRI